MGFYRTWAMLGTLLGINIAVRLFNLPAPSNFIWGNHLVESLAVLSLTTFLFDLGFLKFNENKNYLKIALIAFFGGIFVVLASFSTLFTIEGFVPIISKWFKIAPQMIGLIGIPMLYIADKMAYKPRIFGFENTGRRGLINVFLISAAYSVFVIYLLNKYSFLGL